MRDAPETSCPLCNLPRTGGAARCICGYHFEYGQAPRQSARIAGPIQGAVLACAAVAAIVTFIAMRSDTIGDTYAMQGLLAIGAGLFSVLGGFFGWQWFTGSRRARLFVAVAGVGGARVIYGVLGGVLIGIGAALVAA